MNKEYINKFIYVCMNVYVCMHYAYLFCKSIIRPPARGHAVKT